MTSAATGVRIDIRPDPARGLVVPHALGEALPELGEPEGGELAGRRMPLFEGRRDERRVQLHQSGDLAVATRRPAVMISTGVVSGSTGCSAFASASRLPIDLDEQLFEGAEVVRQRGVRDADFSRDRPKARPVRAALGEDLDRAVEDLLARAHAFGIRSPRLGTAGGIRRS